MKKISIYILITSCFLITAVWPSGLLGNSKSLITQEASYIPGELLVKYKSSARSVTSEYYRTQWNISVLQNFKSIRVQHVKLPKNMTVEDALEIYKNDPSVASVEPNYNYYATAVPNDTHFDLLWGLHNTGQDIDGINGTDDADIDAPEAWDITTGNSNVVVAVIDSGVDYNHPDLSANIWSNPGEIPGNGIDDDNNGYIDDVRGWDFVDNDNDPIDPDGHGTHVAGTIAASGNNALGVIGVSWTAKIIVLRFLDTFSRGNTAGAISAIEYANEMGAHIINNSWGGGGYSQFLKDAIDASPALVICAAGNSDTDNDINPHYPSNYTSPNIMAVAATDQDDNLAYFSNYGAISVDVAAPGTNIYSTSKQTAWSDNFDDNDIIDWTTGGTNNTWGPTNVLSFSNSYSLTDSPAGSYVNNTDSWAASPALDLSSFKGTKFEFQLRGISEAGYDFFYVQASTDGATWTNQDIWIGSQLLSRISGSSLGYWLSASVDLGTYDESGTIYIRFRFISDSSITSDGWYVDNVMVSAIPSSYDGSEYQFLSGTSMAAPHVSGVAALIKAQNPSLTNIEIKTWINNTVDQIPSLDSKMVTGGRVNARNVLLVPTTPGALSATSISASQIDLSWTDNSSNETGFKIERKTESGGTYNQIAIVTADVQSYSNTGLDGAVTYYYRIRASNPAGNSSYSNETNATTSAAIATPVGGGGGGGGCFIDSLIYDSPNH